MSAEIIDYNFKTGLALEIELLDFGAIYRRNKELITKVHRADFYHIIWYTEGTANHMVDFIPIAVKPNSLLFLKKGTVHAFDAQANFEAKAIVFTDAFFVEQQADIQFLQRSMLFNGLWDLSPLELPEHHYFTTIWDLIAVEFNKTPNAQQAGILRHLLAAFLLHAEQLQAASTPAKIKAGNELTILLRFQELLDKHFASRMPVTFYAEGCALSEKQLNKATSLLLGKTPKYLIDERLVLEAKRLLAHSKASIKEIAWSLGFAEPTNFIKFFKKYSRQTPMQFRTGLATA